MAQKIEEKKVVTTAMMNGVLPNVVLPQCDDLAKMKKDDAVVKIRELNDLAAVSKRISYGDKDAAISYLEKSGYEIKKIEVKEEAKAKGEVKAEAKK